MINLQSASDSCAVGFSVTCALHCLFAPLLVTLLPASAGIVLEDEAFHFWLVLAVVPTSILALFMGCRLHGRLNLIGYALVGVSVLALPLILGHELVPESLEKALTLVGSVIIATVHILNFRLCREHCSCTPEVEQSQA